MRILDAILGTVAPYEYSDATLAVALATACKRLQVEQLSLEDDYELAAMQPVALASMYVLVQGLTLSSESVAGASSSYVPDNIKKRVRAIADANDLSASLALSDEDEPTVTYVPAM